MKLEIYLEQIQQEKPEDSSIEKQKNEIKAKYDKKREELKKNKKNIISKLKDQAIEKSKETMDEDIAERITQRIEERIGKIIKFFFKQEELIDAAENVELRKIEKLQDLFEKSKKTAAAAVIAAVVITYGTRTYNKYKKLAKEKCKDLKGEQYKECLKKQTIIALKMRAKEINRQTIRCNKSTDPYKCKARIHRYLLKIRDKIGSYAGNIGSNILSGG